ncbi:MAG: alanine--tRNA ligase [Candidatus Woesearchaeota archaeon]|nr:alanine--tRNA ligase [Candidatus Woesearchaeota archaeon]
MNTNELKEKFLTFFESKGHKRIPSAPLIPENDPTVLFTTAGMHPLVPFLMGQPHPLGKRLCDVQKCIRTGDIDETGDSFHHTFFEMLGNWSLGDYFKEEAITWSFEFLTSKEWLGLPLERLAFSCFAGDEDAPKDEESAGFWYALGVPKERLVFLPKKHNWWGPAGEYGPCGPDTEMFYWKLNDTPAPKEFDPDDDNWVEIWNNVFMQYEKTQEGFIPLKQQNVDTGMGVERVAAVLQGLEDNYRTEAFWQLIEKIQELSGKTYEEKTREMRIIADHIRAAVFVLSDGVVPSNLDQGYILRRFIRRSIRHGRTLGMNNFCKELGSLVMNMYEGQYEFGTKHICSELEKEEKKFLSTLEKGIREFERVASKMSEYNQTEISGKTAFLLFQSYGFPLEMTEELATERNMTVDTEKFHKHFKNHQEVSRQGAEQKFKGGLADAKEQTIRLHTATHLLNEALRKVLSPDIKQKGSNINAERLRFDFNFERKLTDEEKQAVEAEVNRLIQEGIPVERSEMSYDEAMNMGAQAEFGAKYPEVVSVYKIGDYSLELCGGPHVQNTKEIGVFKIKKEQSSAAGIRRIKAVVE